MQYTNIYMEADYIILLYFRHDGGWTSSQEAGTQESSTPLPVPNN